MSGAESIKSNVPEYSVAELAFSLKKTLEENYGRVRVRGELSRVSIAASGHMYSSLKDDQAVIDAVCWKGVMAGLSLKPEEGLEVICTGRISTYPARSNYQLIIESMELAGEGALLKMLEKRRKKLAAEGLFDEARKKPLPFLPDIIGVITSPTGAVIRDILHRLADRFPRHVIVWPVLVQGTGAAEQVADAIAGFNAITGAQRPDLLIVARGGGSLEDLMPFNEEIVVRAAASSAIPLISAVGHETDTTLIDHAADARAPTPTGAAEMAVPVRTQLLAQILKDEQRLLSGLTRLISESRHKLEAQSRGLGDPAKILEAKIQSLDYIGEKIAHVFAALLLHKKERFTMAGAQLRTPKDRLQNAQDTLTRWTEHLAALAPKLIEKKENELKHFARMLEAFSYENVLSRGFAVVWGENEKVITDAAQAKAGQALRIEFKGRKFVETLVSGAAKPHKKPGKKPGKTEDKKQQSLF